MAHKGLMITEKIKNFINKNEEQPNKRKIENMVVFLIILIITIIVINVIWGDDEKNNSKEENTIDQNKKLASVIDETLEANTQTTSDDTMVKDLEEILSKIDGVGKVKVMITYSQTSQTVPLYNNDSSEKSTEETDTQGGTRKITETDTKTEIIYKEENGVKIPITQSVISPTIEGAIVTAEGASNATVKTNIVQAVEAVTGVATHKIQVFEMSKD